MTEDLDDFHVVLGDRRRGSTRRPSTPWRGRPDDPAGRAGAASGRADSAAMSPIRCPLHRHGLPADQAAAAAAVGLARQSDVVIVVGGANSNNTRELVNTCSRHCSRVHHIQTEADLRAEWFIAAATVGITAGTSTPDAVIDRIDLRIRELGARQAARHRTRPGANGDPPLAKAHALGRRRGLCHRHGMGRGGDRVLPSRDGRSGAALPGESFADAGGAGSSRARARGGDAGDAGHGRDARGADQARTGGLCSHRIWRLGYFLLSLSANHRRLAEILVRLGHPLSAAAAMVGTGPRARLDRPADDRRRHPGEPARGQWRLAIGGAPIGPAAGTRHTPRALRVHG